MEKDITIGNMKLHYEVTGLDHAPSLLLMHGWGCDHSTVRSIAAKAAATHRVYNIDLPGFGSSDEPTEVWNVDDYTNLINAFIAAEAISNPILVGHSFGGRIAIQMAAQRSDIDAVVLVDAAGIKPRRSLSYYLKVYSFKTAKFLAHTFMSKAKAEATIEKMRRRRGSSDYGNASPRMRAIMSRCVNQDLTSCLSSIKAPTLLIWGENDTATPMADARKMERLIPDAGLVSFPGCGHYSFLDNPHQFGAALSSFLNSRIHK